MELPTTAILLILGLGQLILAFYLLGIITKIKSKLSGMRIKVEDKVATRKLTEELTREIDKSTSKIEQVLFSAAGEANKSYERNLGNLFEENKKHLSESTLALEKQATEKLEADMQQVKMSLDDYRAARMKAIDANFAEVAARGVELVLKKKLTGDDQVTLINEALEQAKNEKLIT